jgi:hypothetical protein
MASTQKKISQSSSKKTTTVVLPADLLEKAKKASGKKDVKRLILGLLKEEIELQSRIHKYKS